jgi:hypothetical protein
MWMLQVGKLKPRNVGNYPLLEPVLTLQGSLNTPGGLAERTLELRVNADGREISCQDPRHPVPRLPFLWESQFSSFPKMVMGARCALRANTSMGNRHTTNRQVPRVAIRKLMYGIAATSKRRIPKLVVLHELSFEDIVEYCMLHGPRNLPTDQERIHKGSI